MKQARRVIALVFLSGLLLGLLKCSLEGPADQDPIPSGNFTCQGKTVCTEMQSCEEARFYLKNCPNTNIDGDADGIPCEDQFCGH